MWRFSCRSLQYLRMEGCGVTRHKEHHLHGAPSIPLLGQLSMIVEKPHHINGTTLVYQTRVNCHRKVRDDEKQCQELPSCYLWLRLWSWGGFWRRGIWCSSFSSFFTWDVLLLVIFAQGCEVYSSNVHAQRQHRQQKTELLMLKYTET